MRLSFWQKLRTWTGMVSAWVTHLGAFGLLQRRVCSPGFACHGCPWATFACPVGVLAHGSAVRALPTLALASVLAVGVTLGRLVCGFACPFGWFQELLHRIPSPKVRLPRWLRYGKYLALLLLVFLLPYVFGLELLGYARLGKPIVAKGAAGGLDIAAPALAPPAGAGTPMCPPAEVEVTVKVGNPGETPLAGVDLQAVFRNADSGKEVQRCEAVHFDAVIPPGGEREFKLRVPDALPGNRLFIDCPQAKLATRPRHGLYYCLYCPLGTLTAHLPAYAPAAGAGWSWRQVGRRVADNWLRLAILVAFLALMVVGSRPFCRGFCPLGAMYGLCARLALVRLGVDRETCVDCGRCDRSCPVELDVRKEAGGAECVACGDCIKACPTAAIKRRIGLS